MADPPELPTHILRLHALRWKNLVEKYGLTGGHLDWHQSPQRREAALPNSSLLPRPPGSAGKYRGKQGEEVSYEEWVRIRKESRLSSRNHPLIIDKIGTAETIAVAKERFAAVVADYFTIWAAENKRDSDEFPQWLERLRNSVVIDVADLWRKDEWHISWFDRACRKKVDDGLGLQAREWALKARKLEIERLESLKRPAISGFDPGTPNLGSLSYQDAFAKFQQERLTRRQPVPALSPHLSPVVAGIDDVRRKPATEDTTRMPTREPNLTENQQDGVGAQVPPRCNLNDIELASRGEGLSQSERLELPTAGSPDKGNLDLGGVSRLAIEKARWAVCPRLTEGTLIPKRFHSEDDAREWQNEIVVPATILGDEEILPPDPESGFSEARIVRPRVQIRISSRQDAGRDEWIVIERTDGKPISNGVGAFRRGRDGLSSINPDELPQGYLKETRRREQGWWDLVPINWIDERMGDPYAGRLFRDFLPLDRVSSVQATDLDADFEEISEKRCADVTCDLGDDWQFDRLQAGAEKREGHMFRGRVIESLSHQLVRIAYDLEGYLLELHPNLPTQSIAAFWTSWSVGRHFARWCPKILRDMLHKKRSATLLHGTGESMAVRFVYRQLWAYAQEVKDGRAVSHLTGASTGAERPPAPITDEPGCEEPRASNAQADQSPTLALTAEGASPATEPTDHRANRLIIRIPMSDHIADVRVPRMTHEFPGSFPKSARAKIHAERLRGEHVLGEKKNSIKDFADAEALLLELVLRVFVAFAEEGHQLGLQSGLTVEDLESECLRFLRSYAFDAGLMDKYFLVPPLSNPEVPVDLRREIESSGEWRTYRQLLIELADAHAKSEPQSPHAPEPAEDQLSGKMDPSEDTVPSRRSPKEFVDDRKRKARQRSSYEKFAAHIGISKDTLYAITNETRWVKAETYALVAEACECRPEDLHPRDIPRPQHHQS